MIIEIEADTINIEEFKEYISKKYPIKKIEHNNSMLRGQWDYRIKL